MPPITQHMPMHCSHALCTVQTNLPLSFFLCQQPCNRACASINHSHALLVLELSFEATTHALSGNAHALFPPCATPLQSTFCEPAAVFGSYLPQELVEAQRLGYRASQFLAEYSIALQELTRWCLLVLIRQPCTSVMDVGTHAHRHTHTHTLHTSTRLLAIQSSQEKYENCRRILRGETAT